MKKKWMSKKIQTISGGECLPSKRKGKVNAIDLLMLLGTYIKSWGFKTRPRVFPTRLFNCELAELKSFRFYLTINLLRCSVSQTRSCLEESRPLPIILSLLLLSTDEWFLCVLNSRRLCLFRDCIVISSWVFCWAPKRIVCDSLQQLAAHVICFLAFRLICSICRAGILSESWLLRFTSRSAAKCSSPSENCSKFRLE